MIDIESLAARWGRVIELPLEVGIEGAYDGTRGVIFISNRLSDVQRRCVLAHEISHARHHDICCREEKSQIERRANIEAACMIIDPYEYAIAEQISDNAIWLARELNVMPDIIQSYRDWLYESGSCLKQYQNV